jgi:hypothetical protein
MWRSRESRLRVSERALLHAHARPTGILR